MLDEAQQCDEAEAEQDYAGEAIDPAKGAQIEPRAQQGDARAEQQPPER